MGRKWGITEEHAVFSTKAMNNNNNRIITNPTVVSGVDIY